MRLRKHSFSFISLAALVTGCSAGPTGTSAATVPEGAGTAEQIPTASSVPTPMVSVSVKAWRRTMAKTPLPKEGCFEASQSSNTWVEVPCTAAPNVPYTPARGQGGGEDVGNGTDLSSQVSDIISFSEGSFPKVTGVTSETDGTSDNYSLQINANTFSGPALCNGAQNPSSCQGWQQFIYEPGFAFMQYWLLNFGPSCPSGWNQFQNSCFENSNAVTVPSQPITNLANLTLMGMAGTTDTVMMSVGTGVLYAASQATVVNLNAHWTTAEFNIVGNGSGSEAVFNSGASIVTQTLTESTSGTRIAPTCQSAGFTGETNNLNLVSGSCCPIGGTTPGIQFLESNVSGATAQACPFIGHMTDGVWRPGSSSGTQGNCALHRRWG